MVLRSAAVFQQPARPHPKTARSQMEVPPLGYAACRSPWSWRSQLTIWFQSVKIWVTTPLDQDMQRRCDRAVSVGFSFAPCRLNCRRLAVNSRLSFRPARLAVAILGLTIVVSCSGNTTSPTPISTTVPPETSSSTALLWPLAGRDGRDWVINNYVDLDATSGTLDDTGGSGSGAKTSDAHSGIDIDVPSFRWMDGNISNVLAAAGGVVTAIRDTEPDRNTSCAGSANLVQVRHPDGLTALYSETVTAT